MKKSIGLPCMVLLATCVVAMRLANAQQAAPSNPALAQTITQLFQEDQAVLADTNKAVQDAALRDAYKGWVKRALDSGVNSNFCFPQVYALWAQSGDASTAVQRYM